MARNGRVRRKWFQFRLRTLLITTLVLSLPLSWFAVKMSRARRQREAVEAIKQLGGFVDEREEPSVPKWIRASFPKDFFTEVVEVELVNAKDRNAKIEALRSVSTDLEIEKWNLTQIPEGAGFEHLKALTTLRTLSLGGNPVTEAKLEQLRGLANLQKLDLRDTEVTDAGLERLKGLSNLAWLSLDRTEITDAGLEASRRPNEPRVSVPPRDRDHRRRA